MKCLKTILRWLPALFIFGCSWYLSSQETIEHIPTFWNADKLVHCICFAGLAFWVAFAVGTKPSSQWKIVLPVIIVSVWGITDEIHQSFTPGRESSLFDWCADTLGAVIGSLAFFYLCKGIVWYKNKKNMHIWKHFFNCFVIFRYRFFQGAFFAYAKTMLARRVIVLRDSVALRRQLKHVAGTVSDNL